MYTQKPALRIFSVLLIVIILFGSAAFPTSVRAAGIVVDSLLDTRVTDGKCTLREALYNADDDAATDPDCAVGSGADTITFSVSGTIMLTSALPTIYGTGLTIDGTGQTVTISGNHAVRVMTIGYWNSLALNNLTIADGYTTSNGGGIYNDCASTLTVTNTTFSGNNANSSAWGNGGAIASCGTLTVTDSTFSGNSANWNTGGGISSSGDLTVTHTTFSGNSAVSGGGISASGLSTITDSTFSGNSAIGTNGGGGIFNNGGQLTITDSTFSGNSANWGRGGAIYSPYGGGYGTLTITDSTLSGNTATGGQGGGIYNAMALTIGSATVSGNSAGTGGGLYNAGVFSTITNTTIAGNTASDSGTNGGGIYNTSSLIVTNSTLTGNSAPDAGGGVGNVGGTLTLRNTIVSNSISGGNCTSTVTNGASNIEDGATCGWGTAKGSMSNTDPLLGAPTGSPAYFPLDAGSPAIDGGDDAICAASPVSNASQNGVTRPQGTHCDIGSYEAADAIPPTVVSINRAGTSPTIAVNVNFTVKFSESVTGVDTADFRLTSTGVTGPSITGVTCVSGTTYTVAVHTGAGNGSIRLDVNSSGTGITDSSGNPLSGGFRTGQVYIIRKPVTVTYSSGAAQDGWIPESSENSNIGGGVMNHTAASLRLGDDAARRQYRSIISFNTSGLPDTAVITALTLKVRRQGITGGGNPVAVFQGLMLDTMKGTFNLPALELRDFQTTAALAQFKTFGPYIPAVDANGWYTITLPATAYPYVNKLTASSGLTQIRLRFKWDDNNNAVANFLSLYSGEAAVSNRPHLIVQYYMP